MVFFHHRQQYYSFVFFFVFVVSAIFTLPKRIFKASLLHVVRYVPRRSRLSRWAAGVRIQRRVVSIVFNWLLLFFCYLFLLDNLICTVVVLVAFN